MTNLLQETRSLPVQIYSGRGATAWIKSLTTQSVLGHLPLHEFQVSYKVLSRHVVRQLRQMPILPGVIITAGNRMIGLISRSKLLEYLCWQPNTLELLDRPVEALLEAVSHPDVSAKDFLELPDSCVVQMGAIAATNRAEESISDPIVVTFRDHSVRLLNFHDLMVAQARVVELLNEVNSQQQQHLLMADQTLRQEQCKLEQTRQDLLAQQQLIQHQKVLSEQQQLRFTQELAEVKKIKQRQHHIEQFFLEEGGQAVQTVLETAQALSEKNQKMEMMNQALNRELATVQKAAQLIKQIGRQVQVLGLRSAILANRAGIEKAGFSQHTNDIRNLSEQTLEAAHSMEEIVSWLKSYLVDLKQTLQEGTDAADTSIQQALRLKDGLQGLFPVHHVSENSENTDKKSCNWQKYVRGIHQLSSIAHDPSKPS